MPSVAWGRADVGRPASSDLIATPREGGTTPGTGKREDLLSADPFAGVFVVHFSGRVEDTTGRRPGPKRVAAGARS